MKAWTAYLPLLFILSCGSASVKERPESSEQSDTQSSALTVEESRRLAEEAYERIQRKDHVNQPDNSTANPSDKDDRNAQNEPHTVDHGVQGDGKQEDEKKEAQTDDKEKPEKEIITDLESSISSQQEEQQQAELERRKKEREEAVALKSSDRMEEEEAQRSLELFRRNRALLKKEARELSAIDSAEQIHYEREYERYIEAKRKEEEYRSSRIARADTERNTFYRREAQKLFPSRIEIEDVRSRSLQLMRNRNRQQFMGYGKGMKYIPDVQPLPLPQGPPSRFRLYEYFTGRPGNYVLLEEGLPVTIQVRNRNYRIINIYSDGDVLILLDLESVDFREYYRVSVDDIVLLLE
jgi:hypothetical protein